jgi:hypothetical protein
MTDTDGLTNETMIDLIGIYSEWVWVESIGNRQSSSLLWYFFLLRERSRFIKKENSPALRWRVNECVFSWRISSSSSLIVAI